MFSRLVWLVASYLVVGYVVTLLFFTLFEWACVRGSGGKWNTRDAARHDWGLLVFFTAAWPLCIVMIAVAASVELVRRIRLVHWLYEVPFGWIDSLHNGRGGAEEGHDHRD